MKKKKKKIKSKKNKKQKFIIWLWSAVVIFLLVIILGGIGYLYFSPSINSVAKIFYKKIPLPVALVEGKIITSQELFQDVDAVKKFYESKDYTKQKMRVDFSTKEGTMRLKIKEKDILDKLIENEIVKKIAIAKNISISNQEVDKAIINSLKKADSNYEKLAINLKANYGWTVNEFKNKIVKNQLYLKKLFEWYKINNKNSDDYKRLQVIQAELSIDSSKFDDVVSTVSKTEKNEEIMWIAKSKIIPEVAEVIDKIKIGEVSRVIISPLGMHIIIVDEKKDVKNKQGLAEEKIRLRQIFIKGKSFIEWLREQKSQIKVQVLLKEYSWNVQAAEIIFSNSKMQIMEKNIRIKSQGDPSL